MNKEEVDFFDRLAPEWDHNEVMSTPEKVGDILSYCGLKEGDRVLDLGTGTGVLIPFLSMLIGPSGHLLAVDYSSGMLAEARKKFGAVPNVDFKKLDFENEEVPGVYDLIILYCVYPHLHHPETTLRRLADHNLSEGGRIIVAFPSDENFINNIHRERKAESDLLPPATVLASRLSAWGLPSEVRAYDTEHYVVEISRPGLS